MGKTLQGTTHSAGTTVGKVVGTVKKIVPISKSGGNGGGGVVGGVVTTATNVVKSATGGLP